MYRPCPTAQSAKLERYLCHETSSAKRSSMWCFRYCFSPNHAKTFVFIWYSILAVRKIWYQTLWFSWNQPQICFKKSLRNLRTRSEKPKNNNLSFRKWCINSCNRKRKIYWHFNGNDSGRRRNDGHTCRRPRFGRFYVYYE